jgi:hypothetical protein
MCGKITKKHFCTLNMLIKIINKIKYYQILGLSMYNQWISDLEYCFEERTSAES